MRMKKLKLKEGRVYIVFEKMNRRGEYDEYSLNCSEKPHPALLGSLDALIPHVLDMLELPDDDVSRVTVSGVSWSYCDDTEIMGATIIASRELRRSNTPMNLVTPHKFETYTSGQETGDDAQLLDSECVDLLSVVAQRCEAYINGEREQAVLPFDAAA